MRLGPSAVDENLYYRGIHKSDVDHVRRDQAHGIAPENLAAPEAATAALPSGSSAGDADAAESEPEREREAYRPGAAEVPTLPLPYLFRNAAGLLRLTQQHNVRAPGSVLQIRVRITADLYLRPTAHDRPVVSAWSRGRATAPTEPFWRNDRIWGNERIYLSDAEISNRLLKLWQVMDASIHAGVSSRASCLASSAFSGNMY